MKWVIKEKKEIIEDVARTIINLVKKNPNISLGLATGTTMIDLYKKISILSRDVDWSHVKTFNLDEYVGIDKNNNLSFQYFMYKHLFKNININIKNTFFPTLNTYKNYDQLIKKHGGIYLQLLGVGINGHIAFNEPYSSFESQTRIVNLEDSTLKRNKSFLKEVEIEIPSKAYTMGIASILKAKEIYCLAFGKAKIDAMKELKKGKEDLKFPLTSLLRHKKTTIFFDIKF